MDQFFASAHLVDLVLLFMVLEAVVLILLQRLRLTAGGAVTSGPHPERRLRGIVVMLLPGVCLMLALRAALAGVAWPWVPAALTAAFAAHVADIRERWRG